MTQFRNVAVKNLSEGRELVLLDQWRDAVYFITVKLENQRISGADARF